MPDQLFVQKIEHDSSGEMFELAFLKKLTLIETMDLSGPKLIIHVKDPYSWVTDSIGLKIGDILNVTISDTYRDSDNGINHTMQFTVLTVVTEDEEEVVVKINCLASPVDNLKKRAVTGKIYKKKPASYIIKKVFPDLKIEVGRFPVIEDYHMLSGETASYFLKQMALESGSHIFQCRDTAYMLTLADILSGDSDHNYYYDDPTKENQIITYSAPSAQHILEDKISRQYVGWSMIDGWITDGNSSLPPKMIGTQSIRTLKNMSKAPNPVIDFMCTGNGALKPGDSMSITWNSRRREAPVDESLPAKIALWLVAHNYEVNKYFCRVKGCIEL